MSENRLKIGDFQGVGSGQYPPSLRVEGDVSHQSIVHEEIDE